MKIGFFSDSYFPEIDGVTYTLKCWKQRLEERGHEVYIIYPESSEYEPKEGEIPLKSFSNPFYSGYNIPVPVNFSMFPDDLDIIHCHTPLLGVSAYLYSLNKDVSTVYTHHTPVEEYFEQSVKSKTLSNLLGKVYVPFEEFLIQRFDKQVSNTDGGRRKVEMKKLPAGVDMEFFQPTESEWNLESPVIGYSGRISDEKNVDEVIEMSKELDAKLIVVGEGPAKQKLEDEAGEGVVFKDFLDRSDLPGYLSMLDVFVTASTGDTLGLSCLEANACGTPVVAPDVHPFDKTIKEGENGYNYNLGDIEDFRKKVRNALTASWDTRDSVKQYSLEKSINQLEKLYQDLEDESHCKTM